MNNELDDSIQIKQPKESKVGSIIVSVLASVMIFLMAVVIILNTFVFIMVEVQGESMQPTLYTGDCLVANKNSKLDYSDIIVVDAGDKLLIKRVIALGGDTIMLDLEGNVLLKKQGQKDFVLLDETSYLGDGVITTVPPDSENCWELKANQVFYMGDNRGNSADCRDTGPCDISKVKGVVPAWALKKRESIKNVNKFVKKINLLKANVKGCFTK